MRKARKTRKEKILADLHRKLQFTSSTPASTISVPLQPMVITVTRTYPYLLPDLIKTSLITAGIIASELLLFYLLKSHIVKIPNLAY